MTTLSTALPLSNPDLTPDQPSAAMVAAALDFCTLLTVRRVEEEIRLEREALASASNPSKLYRQVSERKVRCLSDAAHALTFYLGRRV